MICELFSFAIECDIPNWLTMILELGIGGSLAALFFLRQQKHGKQIQQLIQNQEEQKKQGKLWLTGVLRSHLLQLKTLLNELDEEYKKSFEDHDYENQFYMVPPQIAEYLRNTIHEMEPFLYRSSGIIKPEYLQDAFHIYTEIKHYYAEHTNKRYYDFKRIIVPKIDKLLSKLPSGMDVERL